MSSVLLKSFSRLKTNFPNKNLPLENKERVNFPEMSIRVIEQKRKVNALSKLTNQINSAVILAITQSAEKRIH